MRILLCPDSFKDSLPAWEVVEALSQGLSSHNCQALPLADGGEGSLEVLHRVLGGEWVYLEVQDPLGRTVEAKYLWMPSSKKAIIEMAQAAGIERLLPEERVVMQTSTYGLGQLIHHALDQGATEIALTLGSSATNDAGIGMAQALGFGFYDAQAQSLPGIGASLPLIAQIRKEHVHPGLGHCRFKAISDVENPLYGPQGAAAVYGPQKGASPADVKYLDNGLINWAERLLDIGLQPDLAFLPGAGAAGGMGAASMAFLNAEMHPGADWIMDLLGMDQAIAAADALITGEGRLDASTWNGKLISKVALRAQAAGKALILVCGVNQCHDLPYSVYPIWQPGMALAEAKANARHYLIRIAEKINQDLQGIS